MPSRHQVDAELALRRLDRGVDLARGHVEALGVELEVVDQRLHRGLHLRPRAAARSCRGSARPRRGSRRASRTACRMIFVDSRASPASGTDSGRSSRRSCRAGSGSRTRRSTRRAAHRRRSQAMPEPRTITPEKPSACASSWLTTAMSTLRCLKMRFSVSSSSMSSSTCGNCPRPGRDVVDQILRQVLVHAARPEIGRVQPRARRPARRRPSASRAPRSPRAAGSARRRPSPAW